MLKQIACCQVIVQAIVNVVHIQAFVSLLLKAEKIVWVDQARAFEIS